MFSCVIPGSVATNSQEWCVPPDVSPTAERESITAVIPIKLRNIEDTELLRFAHKRLQGADVRAEA